jgi:hypothetical protein
MRRLQRAGELQVSGRTLLLHATGTASSVPGAAPTFTVVAPPRSAQGASSAAAPAR